MSDAQLRKLSLEQEKMAGISESGNIILYKMCWLKPEVYSKLYLTVCSLEFQHWCDIPRAVRENLPACPCVYIHYISEWH